jgi:hypothetical protein
VAAMIVLVCAVWLALVILLSNIITRLMTSATSGFLFRLMIFPGVLVHELSHYVMCKLTGAKVVKLKLFEKQQIGQHAVYGGYVTHGPSKLPLLGDPLISFAPVFGCLGVMALLTWAAGDPLEFHQNPAETQEPGADPVSNLMSIVRGVVYVVGHVPGQVAEHASDWKFWAYLYLIVSLSIALAPSKQDFANSYRHFWRHFLKFVLAALVVYAVLFIAGPVLAKLTNAFVPYLVGVIGFTLSILIVTLIIAWLINQATGLIRRS